MRRYLFLISSARRNGNTERLARRAAGVLPPEEQEWLNLADLPLPPFRDIRHDDGGSYAAPEGNEKILADATLRATDLVLVAPVYWYSVPTSLKLYLDYWSAWMRVASLAFKSNMSQKKMWVITVYSGDPEDARPLVEMLQKCAEYLGLAWGGALLGSGSRPGDIERDAAAMESAARFFQGLS